MPLKDRQKGDEEEKTEAVFIANKFILVRRKSQYKLTAKRCLVFMIAFAQGAKVCVA